MPRLHRAGRADDLADGLGRSLRVPLPDPIAAESPRSDRRDAGAVLADLAVRPVTGPAAPVLQQLVGVDQ